MRSLLPPRSGTSAFLVFDVFFVSPPPALWPPPQLSLFLLFGSRIVDVEFVEFVEPGILPKAVPCSNSRLFLFFGSISPSNDGSKAEWPT